MKKIILTGGGTAGHVAPNLALVPALKAAGYKIYYIGSHNGIERELVEAAGIQYFGISSGKLRRYKSFKNATDIFRVSKGLFDALKIIRKIKPDVVFSKGGFVVVPVIAAAKLLRVKSVIHESDMTPGLANKLAMPFAAKICVSFPETMTYIKASKGVVTGTPIRKQLLKGNMQTGFNFTKLNPNHNPVLLVTGGSTGAAAINASVREALPSLLKKFQIVHLCGKGNLADISQEGYVQFEYVNDEMPHIFAMASLVISRAGANTLFELIALNKPNLIIPLPAAQSRGDQIQNAASFKKQGFSLVLPEEELTAERLYKDALTLYETRNDFISRMKEHDVTNGIKNVIDVIESAFVNTTTNE